VEPSYLSSNFLEKTHCSSLCLRFFNKGTDGVPSSDFGTGFKVEHLLFYYGIEMTCYLHRPQITRKAFQYHKSGLV